MARSKLITFRADAALQTAVAKSSARHKPPSASNWIRAMVIADLRLNGFLPKSYEEVAANAGGRSEAPMAVSQKPRVLGFRADEDLLTAIDRAATARTWTRSIYLRSVVVDELQRLKLLPRDYSGTVRPEL